MSRWVAGPAEQTAQAIARLTADGNVALICPAQAPARARIRRRGGALAA
jgi:hypothetical protein